MSDARSRVSIGLPVFNGENYIREALDSIMAQTYSDFELIISDNASTDGTEEICRAYAARDERIRYFRNDTNLGAAKNYNRVFEMSSGVYFKWVAHDDVCAPEFLERCVGVLDREPAISVCYPRTKLIDERGQIRGTYADGLNLRSPKPHERFRQFFETQGLCHAIFGLIRASSLRATRLIGNYGASDRVLLGELVLHGEFCELPEYLFYRRIHPRISTTANQTDSEIAAWFDPKKRDKIVLPRWRRFFEYLGTIKRAPLSWPERASCYIQLAHFVLLPERWRNMVEELLRASRIVHRSLFRSR